MTRKTKCSRAHDQPTGCRVRLFAQLTLPTYAETLRIEPMSWETVIVVNFDLLACLVHLFARHAPGVTNARSRGTNASRRSEIVQGEHGQIHSLERKPLPTDGAREVSKKFTPSQKFCQPKAPQALTTTLLLCSYLEYDTLLVLLGPLALFPCCWWLEGCNNGL